MATQTRHIRDLISEAPVGSFQSRVFTLCFLIAILDGFDTQSIVFIGPAIAKTFGLAPAELTWILTSGPLG
jgi:AAHS family 4-hydroxybenzoate transporter-like MFS transporter